MSGKAFGVFFAHPRAISLQRLHINYEVTGSLTYLFGMGSTAYRVRICRYLRCASIGPVVLLVVRYEQPDKIIFVCHHDFDLFTPLERWIESGT